jgi:hypothetical protein
LSDKYKVTVEVWGKVKDGRTKILLSKKPGQPIKHLAQTTPYQNKLYHFDFAYNVLKIGAVNHSVSAVFLHLHDGGFCRMFRSKFKGAVFNILVGFGLD